MWKHLLRFHLLHSFTSADKNFGASGDRLRKRKIRHGKNTDVKKMDFVL